MASSSVIGERGQVTIPARLRRETGLHEGVAVEFVVVEEGILVRRRTPDRNLGLDAASIASTTTDFERLRDDPDAWQEELRERTVLDGSLTDGMID